MSSRAEVKANFQDGDTPTGAQFADMIDSLAHVGEDGLATAAAVAAAFQPILVSGTSIKTINGTSLLGSGNIVISGGGGTVDTTIVSGSANAVAGNAVFNALALKANLAGPTLTGAWRLEGGYGVGGLRPYADGATGKVGVGIHDYSGGLRGYIWGGNSGEFVIQNGTYQLSIGPTLNYDRFVGTDINGGAAFAPMFALDVTSSNEGGFYCPKSGGVSDAQFWASARTDRVSLRRNGTLEFLAGTSVVLNPALSATPANNGNLVIERTSNTQLSFKLKGTDGVVRTGTLALS